MVFPAAKKVMAFPVQARTGACDSWTRSPAAAARLNPSGKNDSGVACVLLGCNGAPHAMCSATARSTLVREDYVVKASCCDIGVVVTVKSQLAYSMSDAFAEGIGYESAHVGSMSFVTHRHSMQVA